MLLAIDIGNTRIKWGLHDGHQWQQLAFTSHGLAHLQTELTGVARRIIVSDVSSTRLSNEIPTLFPGLPWHLAQASAQACGIHNRYTAPSQLGSDRWLALIGAHHLGAGSAVVVNAGTALTADALHNGEFLGGSIMPGYLLMRAAITSRTGLPDTGQVELTGFPRDTESALVTGCLSALLGSIQHMHATLALQAQNPVDIWLSGGDASLLAPWLACRLEPHLVLEGLLKLAKEVFP